MSMGWRSTKVSSQLASAGLTARVMARRIAAILAGAVASGEEPERKNGLAVRITSCGLGAQRCCDRTRDGDGGGKWLAGESYWVIIWVAWITARKRRGSAALQMGRR